MKIHFIVDTEDNEEGNYNIDIEAENNVAFSHNDLEKATSILEHCFNGEGKIEMINGEKVEDDKNGN